ncbi:FAD:protein FMN transferase [Nitrincola schmidtii]|uniref:FAD:protein FMN transferase n=1 Tax=Nitrincola schmidtii TaxID=1730894 RepID=UPI00124CB1F9|nr:FAD:protein FMN transferase [Nitrincola schmidtii]
MNALPRIFILSVLLVFLVGCSDKTPVDPIKRIEGSIFGTFWMVSIADDINERELNALEAGIKETLDRVDWQMSTWKPESELMQLNRHPVGEWFDISAELIKVLAISQEISVKSDGSFDITVGNLVNLWSFGPEQRPNSIPAKEELEARLALAGHQGLELNIEENQARRTKDFFIDLSGVAKGYGVDEVGRYLQSQGLNNFLVNIGGDLLAIGQRETDQNWRIGIELPHSGIQVAHHIIPVENMSVASSGDYRNYFEEDGRRFSHTIDPKTGWPINHRVASVTVLTPDNVDADAWATAFMVLGIDGLALAEELDLKVLMLEKDDEGWVTHLTSAFIDYVGVEKAQELLETK